jgi:hypothetical protein
MSKQTILTLKTERYVENTTYKIESSCTNEYESKVYRFYANGRLITRLWYPEAINVYSILSNMVNEVISNHQNNKVNNDITIVKLWHLSGLMLAIGHSSYTLADNYRMSVIRIVE